MSKWNGRIFALFLSLFVLCPRAAYSESDEFVPPAQYQQDATTQKISGIRELVFGDDPIAAYAVLTYFTIQRLVALKDLFTQVPAAMKSTYELAHFTKLRKEYLNHWHRTQKLMEAQPALFYKLQHSLSSHGHRLSSVQDTIDELPKNSELEKDAHWKADLMRALHMWRQNGDITRLDEWLDRYNDNPAFLTAIGEGWLRRHKAAREFEELASAEVVSGANKITEQMNEMMPFHERSSLVTHTDPSGRHQPGAFYHFGSGSGPIRLNNKTIVQNMQERCDLGFAFFSKINSERARTGSWHSPFMHVGVIGIPVFTAGSAAVLTALTVRVYYLSYKKFGTDPSSAERKVRHDRNVQDSVMAAGERTVGGQVSKKPELVNELLEPLAQVLFEHRDEILAKAKQMHELKPTLDIDYEDKANTLADKAAIKDEISKHLSASRTRISEELTLDQFLLYMNRAPNIVRYRAEVSSVVDEIYARTLDSMFMELKFKTTVDGQLKPVTFGSYVTEEGREEWVKQSLPGLKGLKLPVPENTPGHPSIPKPEPKRQPGTEKSATGDGGALGPSPYKNAQPVGEAKDETKGQNASNISGEFKILGVDGPELPTEF